MDTQALHGDFARTENSACYESTAADSGRVHSRSNELLQTSGADDEGLLLVVGVMDRDGYWKIDP